MSKVDKLLSHEITELDRLKTEHRPYFDAVMYCVNVLVERNHKYTGDEKNRDVFANFELDAKIQNVDIQETFKQGVSKKTAIIMINDKDYGDASFTDSLRDLVNYSLLWIGYIFSTRNISSFNKLSPIIVVGHTDYYPREDK